MEEIWKDVKGYEGLYQVSNFGRVKSMDRKIDSRHHYRERILKPSRNRWGYQHVIISKNNQRKQFRVNRLVALHFIPNPENKPEVNHIDGDKTNNHVENLEWVTASENIRHAVSSGLKIAVSGENQGSHKLTWEQVTWIREHYIYGSKNMSQRKLAKMFNISQREVGRIISNKNWRE